MLTKREHMFYLCRAVYCPQSFYSSIISLYVNNCLICIFYFFISQLSLWKSNLWVAAFSSGWALKCLCGVFPYNFPSEKSDIQAAEAGYCLSWLPVSVCWPTRQSRLVHALDNLTLGVCGTEAPTTHTLLHSRDKKPKHRGIRRKIKQHSTDAMASWRTRATWPFICLFHVCCVWMNSEEAL